MKTYILQVPGMEESLLCSDLETLTEAISANEFHLRDNRSIVISWRDVSEEEFDALPDGDNVVNS
jgi:hypothetical protein